MRVATIAVACCLVFAAFVALITMLRPSGAEAGVDLDNRAIRVLSKSDLTAHTSVYVIRVESSGREFVIVNGKTKCAIVEHGR